jgi:hypothetical protein
MPHLEVSKINTVHFGIIFQVCPEVILAELAERQTNSARCPVSQFTIAVTYVPHGECLVGDKS